MATAQRVFQGVRKGEIRSVPLATLSGPTAGPTKVSLRELDVMSQVSERIELLLGALCSINLESLSTPFRQHWRMAFLSVQMSGSHGPSVFTIRSYPVSMSNIKIEGLAIGTAQKSRIQLDSDLRTSIFVREDLIYTAYFVQRAKETPDPIEKSVERPVLSCLSLTNNNDVAFVFPFEGTKSPRVLWANKAKLAAVSTYFASMISGGFQESGKPLTDVSKVFEALKQDLSSIVATERAEGGKATSTADDSDDDPSDATLDQDEMQAETGSEAECSDISSGTRDANQDIEASPSIIHYVVIRDTPSKTYRALFIWFETREITFARLKSTSSRQSTRASPKSVYRLCHQLGIDDLKALALANFDEQLSSSNVLRELFSTNCFYYPELREAALRVLEDDWTDVKTNGGLDALLDIVNKGGRDTGEMMRVAIDILKRL